MGLFNELFKSTSERAREEAEKRAKAEREEAEKRATAERENRRARTKAKMKAESAVVEGRASVQKLERENIQSWAKALEYIKSGRKSAARMELGKYRANARQIEQFEKKVWIMQHYLTRLENAQTDEIFAESLGEIARLVEVDPAKTTLSLENAQSVLDDQTEIDRLWTSCFQAETRKDEYKETELTPDLDGLMKELEAEAAQEIGGTARVKESDADALAREIAVGRENLQNILDENDQKSAKS